jgi:hypothetical protein
MFAIHSEVVLGVAEMLKAVWWGSQPFRFVTLDGSDRRRLSAAIQASLIQKRVEEEWIDTYRAKLAHRDRSGAQSSRAIIAALALVSVCLASAMYMHCSKSREATAGNKLAKSEHR